MLETPHVVVAAAIATKVANPALAIPLALGSHFILEKIPHWNPHINTEMKIFGKISNMSKKVIVFDVILSLFFGFYIASLAPNNIRALAVILTCFVAVTPDLIKAPYYLLGTKIDFIVRRWIPFKKSLQADASFFPGLLSQIIIVAVSLLWVLT